MAKVHDLLEEYGESHQHPVNKRIHWICVPLIVWSLLGVLWSIELPTASVEMQSIFNSAILAVFLSMIYYLSISRTLAIGILSAFMLLLIPIYWLDNAGLAVWKLAVVVFIVAWIGQFIGHSIEGKRPSFFKDIQFLLIGPLWLLSFVYEKLDIRY